MRDERADGGDCQQHKVGQKKGPCRVDVDVAEESPSPGDRQQRGTFRVGKEKETENITSHLITRLARGFGIGGDAQAMGQGEGQEPKQEVGRGAQSMVRQHGRRGGQGRRAGRKSASVTTTEEGRDGEKEGGNSFRLPGWDYTSPQPSALRHSSERERETSRRDTACISLPAAFSGDSP